MPDPREVGTIEDQIARELMQLHRESYGKGAGRIRAHLLDDSVVCFLDDLELQPNEQYLVEAGKGDAVVEVRSRYQQAIESTFSAAVERATGRRVVGFVSATRLTPHWAVEIFRLGPEEESTLEEPGA